MIMFVPEKDLTGVVENGREALAGHPQFVLWGDNGSETELRATMSCPGDGPADGAVVDFGRS